jgi:dihydrofolate synthase/folylpolyglutamate synthase
MTYADAVRFMSQLRRFGMKLGNERMEELLRRVGDPHRKFGVAHVTGTKGKGSTTAMIAALLHAHGFTVGGYFSPYVYDLCERVQLDGRNISRRDFARLVARLAPHIAEISRGPLGPVTEFELKTALGMLYFAEKQADYAAIEVGIGGRLDATNVVEPLVSVITNVGLDHAEVLGSTISAIAFEKAGIIKPGAPVVTAVHDPEALPVIVRTAVDARVPLYHVAEAGQPVSGQPIVWSGRHDRLYVSTPRRTYSDLSLHLVGRHQCANAACAIAALEAIADARGFTVEYDAVRRALASVTLPGRFSILRESPTVIADGAHNGLSAEALAASIREVCYDRLILVVGMLRGHDPHEFVRALAPYASVVIATQPTWRRAQDACVVAAVAREYCADVRIAFPPVKAARLAISQAGANDLVLITGSFYTVGDVPPTAVLRATREAAGSAPAPVRRR